MEHQRYADENLDTDFSTMFFLLSGQPVENKLGRDTACSIQTLELSTGIYMTFLVHKPTNFLHISGSDTRNKLFQITHRFPETFFLFWSSCVT